MKKTLAIMLTLMMTLSMAACGGKDSGSGSADGGSDMDYVKEKGTLVVGITDFEDRKSVV